MGIVEPTDVQILNAQYSGWRHLGEGIFEKNGNLGRFTDYGWHVD